MSTRKEWVIADVQPDGTPWFYCGRDPLYGSGSFGRTGASVYTRKTAEYQARRIHWSAFADARRVLMHVDEYEACVAMLRAANALAP